MSPQQLYQFFLALAQFFEPKRICGETLAGAVDGTNKIFTLANAPGLDANNNPDLQLFEGNGIALLYRDYTIAGVTVTFIAAPTDGPITAFYSKA